MRQPRLRRWLSSSVFVLALVSAPGAQQLTKPPGPKQGGPSHTIQFKVSLEPESLVLRREQLEDKSVITHVTLAPASGEPVFYTDEPGWPNLPRLARLVALPNGAKVRSVTVTPGKTATVPDVRLVGWASRMQPGQKQPGDNPNDPNNRFAILPELPLDDKKREVYYPAAPVPPNPDVLKLQAYPESTATQHDLQPHTTSISVLRIDIAPVQWQIAKGELTLTTDLIINVTIDGNMKFERPGTPGEGNMLDDLRAIVVNPGDLPFWFFDPRPIDVPYLIITDDNYWTPDFERTPGANLVAEFEALAQWKREKGVRATVVRIADIVDGRYGDFRSGARDLQETIRNFLKHAESHYRTQWVLLGGDVEIVPPRDVTVWGWANAAHHHWQAEEERPARGQVYWDSANGRVLMNVSGGFTHVISPRSGRTFVHAADPTEASPGWRVTDVASCDMTGAPAGSRCIEVIAPAADIENTTMALALSENTIPTDLYYASLRGPHYGTPGRHDWDLNDDGLYGTNLWDRSADGVSYWPTLRVGRAPVGTAIEARNFISKTRNYERHTMPSGFAGKHLLAADYWGAPPKARKGTENPPPEGRSYHDAAGDFTVVHFGSAPSPATDWRIVAWNRSDAWEELSYTREAGPGIDGYYFCTDATCAVRSEFPFPLLFVIVWIPVPTNYVKVEATSDSFENAAWFFFDHRTPDGAMVEKEQVKALFTRHFTGLDERQRLYKDIYDFTPEPDLSELFAHRVTEALTRGVNITSLTGHGWYGGCCGLERDEVPNLNFSSTAGVVYADSCLTNEFDQAAGDAVSELLLTQDGGGAVAYVGNTRLSWIGLGQSFERSFWLRMRTTRHMGALHNSKAPYTATPNEQWTNFSLNLMGDPEMEIWRQDPRRMRFDGLAAEVFQGNRIRGRVIDRLTGDGVPLARVTLTGPGVWQTDIADGSGNFEFTPAGRPDDALTVTATHIVFEYAPVSSDVHVRRRVFTFEPPPGLPPSWPPGLPRRP